MTNGTPPWELGVGRWEAGIYSSIEILKTGHFRAAQASPPRPPFLCPVAHASHGNSRTCCTSLVLQAILRARPMHCVSESLGTQQQAFPHCSRLPAAAEAVHCSAVLTLLPLWSAGAGCAPEHRGGPPDPASRWRISGTSCHLRSGTGKWTTASLCGERQDRCRAKHWTPRPTSQRTIRQCAWLKTLSNCFMWAPLLHWPLLNMVNCHRLDTHSRL